MSPTQYASTSKQAGVITPAHTALATPPEPRASVTNLPQMIGARLAINFHIQSRPAHRTISETATIVKPSEPEIYFTSLSSSLSSSSSSTSSTNLTVNDNYEHDSTNGSLLLSNHNYTVDQQPDTSQSADYQSQFMTVIQNPDLLLAFAMIIFYLIFVLFIVAVILRIALTILCSGGGIGGGRRLIALMASAGTTVLAGSGETNSDSYDPEMSSSLRTRGLSQSQHTRPNRRTYLQEMTSFIGGLGDRTNSPSAFDDYDDDES